MVSSYAPEEENQEEPAAVILGVVANLFQKVIELLARRLRKQPEEGKQVFKLAARCAETSLSPLLKFSFLLLGFSCVSRRYPG